MGTNFDVTDPVTTEATRKILAEVVGIDQSATATTRVLELVRRRTEVSASRNRQVELVNSLANNLRIPGSQARAIATRIINALEFYTA